MDSAAEADAKVLTVAGIGIEWKKRQSGKREAEITGLGETIRLEWVHDSAFRFFPAQRDELFGFVLHPVDLATNKVAAAADRREPRDIVDLVTIHDQILPLGAVICAAVGRFPGQSPEEMHSDIRRIPSQATGMVFLKEGIAVQPDPDALGEYERHAGALGGIWPSSPEIRSAMLERYDDKREGS